MRLWHAIFSFALYFFPYCGKISGATPSQQQWEHILVNCVTDLGSHKKLLKVWNEENQIQRD